VNSKAHAVSWIIAALSVACVFIAVFFVYRFEPGKHAYYPVCVFHQITGWSCPGCGGLRAVHAFTHGDFAAAWNFNPLMFFALPLLAYSAVREFSRNALQKTLPPRELPKHWGKIVITVIVAFGILRNF
jgi:hypothetical protein